ncbi:hypothetical protein D3C80_1435750 [compost metagenome]
MRLRGSPLLPMYLALKLSMVTRMMFGLRGSPLAVMRRRISSGSLAWNCALGSASS